MKTPVSPLGALYISFAVARWNESDNIERKGFVKGLLGSKNTVQMHEAFHDLHKITDEKSGKFGVWKNTEMTLGYMAVWLSGNMEMALDDKSMLAQQALIDRARGEMSFYLISAFEAGHLEKLPLPEFEYPDIK